MSQLETFYVLFKAETGELKKQIESVEQNLGKLEKDLGNVDKAAAKTGESFNNLLRSAVGMFAGFASFHAILSGANGAIESIREVGQASRELQVDVKALDAWGNAVQRVGGTAQSFQHSLEGLAHHFGTTNEIALRVLPRLADVFHRLNPRQAQMYGKSLGLDQSTILLLQQGRREVEDTIRQQQRLGLVTQQQVETTRKFDNALYDAGRAYKDFYRELVTPLLPGFTKAINYAIDHKDAVADAFSVITVAVGLLSVALIRLNVPLAIAVSALSAFATGYAIVKDDLKAYQEGRPSITGDVTKAKENFFTQTIPRWAGFKFLPDSITGQNTNIPFISGNSASGSKQVNVDVGGITIQTAATDAAGIAGAGADVFKNQIAQVISNADNGIAK